MATYNNDKFQSTIVGKSNNIFDIIPVIGSNGDLMRVGEIDAIITACINLLMINHGSYLFDPDLGVGLQRYLFDELDDATEINILNDIEYMLSSYQDRAIIKPTISYMSNNRGFIIDLEVKVGNDVRRAQVPYSLDLLKEV